MAWTDRTEHFAWCRLSGQTRVPLDSRKGDFVQLVLLAEVFELQQVALGYACGVQEPAAIGRNAEAPTVEPLRNVEGAHLPDGAGGQINNVNRHRMVPIV
jgi:hypothetical protein